MFQDMPPEVLAQVRAKALETRRANKAKIRGLSWEEQERLRMREDLASLHDDFSNAKDGKEKMYIASAMTKLAQAAGLPNAGNYRPTQKPERSKPSLGPLD